MICILRLLRFTPIKSLEKVVAPDFSHLITVWRALWTVFVEFDQWSWVARDTSVARIILLRPLFKLLPASTLPGLVKPNLPTNRVARCIVCLTHYILPQGFDAVHDMHPIAGQWKVILELVQGDSYALHTVEAMNAV